MEDFTVKSNLTEEEKQAAGTLNMSVSPICVGEDGKKYAYVHFTDDVRSAEGRIPECIVEKNNGFAAIEVEQLESYMKEHLGTLKQMAANIHVLDAFLKD